MLLAHGGTIAIALGTLVMLPPVQGQKDKPDRADRVMYFYRHGEPVIVRLKKIDEANFKDANGLSYKLTGKSHSVDVKGPFGSRTTTLHEFRVITPLSDAADQADLVWLHEGEPPQPLAATAVPPVAAPPVEIVLRGVANPVRGVLNAPLGVTAATKWIVVDTADGQLVLNNDDIVMMRYLKP